MPAVYTVPYRLTRREFAITLAAAGSSPAQNAPASPGLGLMMWEHLLDQLQLLDQRRRNRFEKLASPEDLAELRGRVRAKLAEMWGPLPKERTPLQPRRVGTIDRGDYVVEKIIYQSRPRFYVTANLYRPKGAAGPLPAVIFSPGHADLGKAYEPYQRFCIRMARSGFVVLIWDPISQGERVQLWDAETSSPQVGFGTREHGVLGRQCYLLGLNLMQYRVWDAIRAIDYLETRPEVDAERIAMAGNSGGGMETLQLISFENRIQAALAASAVATFRDKTEALLIADPEQILYGTLSAGIDHPELLAAFAPRPLMIGSPIRDYVPIAGARRTFHDVSKAYGIVNARDRVRHVETDARHGLNDELRGAAADWFTRWLDGGNSPAREQPVELLDERQLRCTRTGQAASSFNSLSVLDLNRAYADKIRPRRELPANRAEFEIYRNEIANHVLEITRVGRFEPETGIFVTDRTFEAGAFARGLAVVVAEAGKDDPAIRRAVIDPIIAAGYQVLALDLRGWGESTPVSPGKQVSFSWDDFFAYRGLEMGRPMLGQRMRDLLGGVPRRTKRGGWIVVGVGAGALVAAHAAAVEPRIESVVAISGLLSYRMLIDDPLFKEPFSSFLPGVIGAYDTPDLYAAIAPRPVLLINPRDSQRKTIEASEAQRRLAWSSSIYGMLGAGESFSVKSRLDARGVRAALSDWLK